MVPSTICPKRKIILIPEMENNIQQSIGRLQNEQFTVTTDSSEYTLGAELSQEKGQRRKTCSICQKMERELLGIIWAIDNFWPYVFGRKSRVQTDNRPLQWVARLSSRL